MGVCEATNKQKQRQWKQRTKAREQGNKEQRKQGTRARRPTGPDVIFRRQNNLKQKKMEKSKKIDLVNYYYNQNKFKEQSVENQRFDLLELTSALMEYADNVKRDCKYLENKIDTIRDPKLLNTEINHQSNVYACLSYQVMQVEKTFARLNSFMEIYLTNKNDEQ